MSAYCMDPRLTAELYCHLTTTGRRTGKPRRIEWCTTNIGARTIWTSGA